MSRVVLSTTPRSVVSVLVIWQLSLFYAFYHRTGGMSPTNLGRNLGRLGPALSFRAPRATSCYHMDAPFPFIGCSVTRGISNAYLV